MCGICGQFNYRNQTTVQPEVIWKMTNTMIHRGPDAVGHRVAAALGLGFCGLTVIVLVGGHQPMSDEEENVWVIFNGEIYNFIELRKELEWLGCIFRTRSDTEVLIHGYKQWGEELFNHLNGMFGVAIWDLQKRKLILSRDPMGIKIIYYTLIDGTVFFGSEIRPVQKGLGNKSAIDPVSMNLFLRYRYTPSPLTLYDGIRKLAPGTMLVLEKGEARLERWYRFKPRPFVPRKDPRVAEQELLEIYKRSVKRHLISDVPVGLLLSGGVDSGLLLGLMTLYGTSWQTYTVGYGHTFSDDELTDAKETASLFSARNTQIMLDRNIFEDTLPKIVSFLEEPIASSSIVPMYFVCERARQDVKVALVGQGPDELFGGYVRHLGIRYSSYWRAIPSVLRNGLTSMILLLPRNETLKRGVNSLNISGRIQRYQNVFSILPGVVVDDLFKDDILPSGAGDEILNSWSELEPLMDETEELGGFQFLEVRSSLPDELLMYADKLSMAHSLEVRVPYLDREVVEYVERLPDSFKVRMGRQKWLHRKVCEGFLPPSILRRKKRGFAVNVVDDWFRNSMSKKLNGYLNDELSLIYRYLRPSSVRELLHEHQSGRTDNNKILFSLVVLEEWLRNSSHSFANV